MRRVPALAVLVCLIVMVLPPPAQAQPRQGRFIDVDVGVAFSNPDYESDSRGVGFLAKGEYVFGFLSWAGVRPYAGVLFTWPDGDDEAFCASYEVDCDVSAKIVFAGAKGRLAAPIPYVAPFLELGLGGSLGVIRTRTISYDGETKGAAYHIPISIGLALGADHSVEVAFEYLFHPAQEQTTGGITLGLSFVAPGEG